MNGPAIQPALFRAKQVRFTISEKEVFRRPRPMPVSGWAAQYLQVPPDSPSPGYYKPELTPYLNPLMDLWGEPHVKALYVMLPPQSGKTIAMYACLFYPADRDPGNALLVMADEETAKGVADNRLKPMATESPRLKSLLAPINPTTQKAIKFRTMKIDLAWATSVPKLATFSYRYLGLDEVDKYPEFKVSNKEVDPIKLAKLRQRTYKAFAKEYRTSSPTGPTSAINAAVMEEADVILKYWMRCPYCGHFHLADDENLKWPEDVDVKYIEADTLAWYECPECKERWSDGDRDRASRAGEYVPMVQDEDSKQWEVNKFAPEFPQKIGVHVDALPIPFISLSEYAAVKIKADGDKAQEKHLYNNYKGLPWVDTQTTRTTDLIKKLKDDRPRDMVPRDVAALFMGADTQDNGFFYELRAFGYGEDLPSWQIRCGFVESFAALQKIALAKFKDIDGKEHQIKFGLIDAMGHRTTEVYQWTRSPKIRNRIFPCQGAPGRRSTPHTVSLIENWPGTNKKIPGGVKLYRLDTHAYKDRLSSKVHIARDDPGAWVLNADTPDMYANHFKAEHRDERELWVCPNNRANHYWDCAVYVLAAAYIMDVGLWQKDKAQPKPKKKPRPRTSGRDGGRRLPSWYRDRRRR